MLQLDPAECRVLGVLVEKAHTTPSYPLSLNALADGCNQKSNRNPVVNFDEEQALLALDRLRAKRLAVLVDALGSRVSKYRHEARETLGVDNHELVILTELLLRGPQTAAELRARASRMQPLESADVAAAIERLTGRAEPLVKRLPGGRAERFVQLLCPGLHPTQESPVQPIELPGAGIQPADQPAADRLARVEAEVAELRRAVERLAESLGAADIFKRGDGDGKQPGPSTG